MQLFGFNNSLTLIIVMYQNKIKTIAVLIYCHEEAQRQKIDLL